MTAERSSVPNSTGSPSGTNGPAQPAKKRDRWYVALIDDPETPTAAEVAAGIELAVRAQRLVDAAALAAFIGISPSTIKMWAVRGKITRYPPDHRGRTLYDVDEVLRHAIRTGHDPRG